MGPKQKITRDVRMSYTLYIEEVRGAVPNRNYIVNFSRGEKIQGSTLVKKSDEDGTALFNFIAEFAVTLQRKNDSSYKKKEIYLEVVDIATNMPVCDFRYNLATPVANEEVPLKKMMAKSENGQTSLWFGLSATTEAAALNATKAPKRSQPADSPVDDSIDGSVIDDAIDVANSGRRANSSRGNSARRADSARRAESKSKEDQPAAVAAPAKSQSRQHGSEAREDSAAAPIEDEEEEGASPPPKVTVKKSRTRTDSANFSRSELEADEQEQQAAQSKKSTSAAASPNQEKQSQKRDAPSAASQLPPSSASKQPQSPKGAVKPKSPPVASSSEIARWLAVIGDAAVTAPTNATKEGGSYIPKGALLILSALKKWEGEKRLVFVHDLILYLYQDVLRHTRHYGAWISILVHVLYDTLSQVEACETEDEQFQQEEEEQQVADELLVMLEDRQLLNETLKKSYVSTNNENSNDELSRFLSDWILSPSTHSVEATTMSSPLVVIISVTADDVLRRLCTGLAKKPIGTLKQTALPPNAQPAWATNDGYSLALPILKNQDIAKKAMVQNHMVESANVAILLNTLDSLYDELLPPVQDGGSNPPLMRLTTVEVFKIVIRNVAAAFLNNLTKDGGFVVKNAKDALNLKLAISLVERWLQEHQLYMSCRAEFLPLRQFIDVAILQKKVLAVNATRVELAKHLPVPFLYNFLLQFEPNPRDLEEDIVPAELLKDLEHDMRILKAGIVDKKINQNREQGKTVSRKEIDTESEKESRSIQAWKYASLGNFPFFDFLYGLLPTDDAEDTGAAGAGGRQSMRKSARMSVRQSIRKAHLNDDRDDLTQGEKSKNLSLDWDVQYEYLATADDMEAIFPGGAEKNKEFVNVRLAALSLPNDEQLDSISGM